MITKNYKLQQLIKTKTPIKNDEWYSYYFSANIAVAINYYISNFNFITPNFLTIISFLTSIISCIFIINNYFILAVIFINISFILDCMDGQLARYKNITSKFGDYIDKMSDYIKIFVLFFSVAISEYYKSNNILSIILFILGFSFYSFRVYAKQISKINSPEGFNEASFIFLLSICLLFKYNILCLWIFAISQIIACTIRIVYIGYILYKHEN